jgi:hypothetical protein
MEFFLAPEIPMKTPFAFSLLATLLTLPCFGADDPPQATTPPATQPAVQPAAPTNQSSVSAMPSKEELEKKFQETLNNVTLVGHFTSNHAPADAPLKEDKYTIESVTKVAGDLWLFKARIQYGGHDTTVPLPLKVLWAGDTPVITVDKMPFPGLGTYTARVLIYDNKYVGTWDGANHGGTLFGRIEKAKEDAKEAK